MTLLASRQTIATISMGLLSAIVLPATSSAQTSSQNGEITPPQEARQSGKSRQNTKKPTAKGKELFWDYPELLAVPSASALVKDYAQDEPSRSLMSYVPLQVMGLGNVIVGIKAMGEAPEKRSDGSISRNPKLAGQVAIGVGLATIGGTYLLSRAYTPYRDGVSKLQRRSDKSARARLTKEREAEHIISNAASSAQSIRIIGVLANVFAAANMMGNSEDDNTQIGGGLILLSALGPFMFTPYQVELPGRYDSYKKRIYGPISFVSSTPSGLAGNFGLRLQF